LAPAGSGSATLQAGVKIPLKDVGQLLDTAKKIMESCWEIFVAAVFEMRLMGFLR
jgi:hypothetical protein